MTHKYTLTMGILHDFHRLNENDVNYNRVFVGNLPISQYFMPIRLCGKTHFEYL